MMEEWEGKSTFPVSLGRTLVGPRDGCTGEGRPKGRTVSKKGDLWRGSAVKGTRVFPEPRRQGPRTTPYTLFAIP